MRAYFDELHIDVSNGESVVFDRVAENRPGSSNYGMQEIIKHGYLPGHSKQVKSIAMKRRFSILLLIVLATTANGFSQQSKAILPDNVKILNPGSGHLNSINIRAMRDFVDRYENATDVVWIKVPDGFVARFCIDSLNSRAAYKKNGNWVYTIKQYTEAKMSKALRHSVKSTYYDYAITLVEQIEMPDEPVKYIVHLQDAVSWKNVLVSNGQLDLIEDRKKL